MRALSQWENDKINYGEEIADNSFAAQQGYADAQLQLNEQFNQAAFAQEGDLIKLLGGQGRWLQQVGLVRVQDEWILLC